jgi:hypothetical protein
MSAGTKLVADERVQRCSLLTDTVTFICGDTPPCASGAEEGPSAPAQAPASAPAQALAMDADGGAGSEAEEVPQTPIVKSAMPASPAGAAVGTVASAVGPSPVPADGAGSGAGARSGAGGPSGDMNTSVSANVNVNFTSVLLSRVGSMSRLTSVSSCLALSSMLRLAPLTQALGVLLLNEPHGGGACVFHSSTATPVSSGAATSTSTSTTSAVSSSPFSTPEPQQQPHLASRYAMSPAAASSAQAVASPAPTSTSSSSSSSSGGPADHAAPAPASSSSPAKQPTRRTLDESLAYVCSSLAAVAFQSLDQDIAGSTLLPGVPAPSPAPAAAAAASPTPSSGVRGGARTAAAGTRAGIDDIPTLDLNQYIEVAAGQILSRVPPQTLTSILMLEQQEREGEAHPASDEDNTTASMDIFPLELVQILQQTSAEKNKNGVLDALVRRLTGFLSLKYDDQIALSSLLQRTMVLLCVVVLPAPHRSAAAGAGGLGEQFLKYMLEFLRICDKLWKEIREHAQRLSSPQQLPGGGAAEKVCAMRRVLHVIAATEVDNSLLANERAVADADAVSGGDDFAAALSGGGGRRVTLSRHRLDPASWKLVEKESAQMRTIMESAVAVHELRAELRSYVFALRSLRSLVSCTLPLSSPLPGAAPAVDAGEMRLLPGPQQEGAGEGEEEEEEEQAEDRADALHSRHLMHLCGLQVPAYRGEPWTLAQLGGPLPYYLHYASPPPPPAAANSAVRANVAASLSTGASPYKRLWLLNSLEQRSEEFLAEFSIVESGLDALIGTVC